jgi:two-component system, NtrC family, sensor kinase
MNHSLGTILVVDDEVNNVEMLSRRLQRHHYTVDSARSGHEAFERLIAKAYDVTLLDVMMPGLDGLGVLRKLRSQAINANTPVIMVTAKSASDDVAEAFDYGADDFIAKPIDFRVLLARLKSQIARHQAQRHLVLLNQKLNETVAARTRHLQDVQSQLANVAENLPVVLWRLESDEHGRLRLMFLHGAVQTVLGGAEPTLGEDLGDMLRLLHPDDQDIVTGAMEELTGSHKPVAMDVRLALPEGQRWVHLAARLSSLDPHHIDGILLDVHDRKHLEAQLLHTQKLESVGQLASGIAHEINSPAQYTRDNIGFLKETLGGLVALVKAQDEALSEAREAPLDTIRLDELAALKADTDLDFVLAEVPAALDQSLDGIDRISRIVNAMKGFTHPGGDAHESCDLNKLIEDTLTIARNEWKYVAELTVDLDPAMPFVSCFPGELGQVVLNLIVNAAHAIGEVRAERGGMGTIIVSSRYCADDRRVEIRIGDDGPGVPENLKNRIFDPFFTTKPVGKGTGQGLAIARSVIVDKHKGSLALDDSTGRGAVFVISIPA